ncbi:MAG TPA: nucleoside deaminase [Acidisarcina sp.]
MQPAFMEMAIALATENVRSGAGGPFGAVVVKGGSVVAKAANAVTSTNDPTAHAEVLAIRRACQALNHYQLDGCELYTSCEPCPMCLGAIYWARPAAVYYANTRAEAAAAGFDDSFIYEQVPLLPHQREISMIHLPHPAAHESFHQWGINSARICY